MFSQIRHATPADAQDLVKLINALAEYEHLLHESHPDADALAQHLAPDADPRCEALVAEITVTTDNAGNTLAKPGTKIVGMALYFYNYSTFLTKWGIFLEDLFVLPDYRGKGIGFALLKELARVAVKKGCRRLDWNVLDWNQLAIDFYEQIGAKPLSDWTTMRLSGEALLQLGRVKPE